jgi:hypothetical protein
MFNILGLARPEFIEIKSSNHIELADSLLTCEQQLKYELPISICMPLTQIDSSYLYRDYYISLKGGKLIIEKDNKRLFSQNKYIKGTSINHIF